MPERFVRGGPNLTFSFKYILVDEGRGGPNTTISGPSSADDGATVNAGFDCSFVFFFSGNPDQYCLETLYFVIFFRGGWCPDPLSPLWIRPCLIAKTFMHGASRYCRLSRRGESSLRHQLIERERERERERVRCRLVKFCTNRVFLDIIYTCIRSHIKLG